jgi:hypothetical protein
MIGFDAIAVAIDALEAGNAEAVDRGVKRAEVLPDLSQMTV